MMAEFRDVGRKGDSRSRNLLIKSTFLFKFKLKLNVIIYHLILSTSASVDLCSAAATDGSTSQDTANDIKPTNQFPQINAHCSAMSTHGLFCYLFCWCFLIMVFGSTVVAVEKLQWNTSE